jgi:hypothetical protein
MEFGKDISKLKDEDLPRYRNFLLDQILEEQPPARRKESFRSKVLDRVGQVDQEIETRNGYRERNKGGGEAKSED